MFRLLAATNEAPLITAPQTDSSACDCRLKSLDTRTCRLANETMVARHFAPGYHQVCPSGAVSLVINEYFGTTRLKLKLKPLVSLVKPSTIE